MGSDITGTWTCSLTPPLSSGTFTCTFESDGNCSVDSPAISFIDLPAMEVTGTWSLNGTTVTIDASCSDSTSGTDLSTTQTYTYNDSAATLALKSISVTGTAEGEEIDIEYEGDFLAMITLQKSTN